MEKIQTDTLVVGGGPGGYAAAIRLGQLGIDCVLVEEKKVGGTCLNVGCIPSKALLHASSSYKNISKEYPSIGIEFGEVKLNWGQVIRWKDNLVEKLTKGVEALLKANKVRLVNGKGQLLDSHNLRVSDKIEIEFKKIILATGSQVIELPSFPFSVENIVNSTDLLSLSEIPKSLIILGGGIIGMELGCVYASVGSEVTVIEMLDRILPTYETEAVRIVEKSFKSMGGKILCGSKALSYNEEKDKSITLTYESKGKQEKLNAEKLAVAVGRKSNFEGLNLEALTPVMERGRIVVNDKLQTNHPHVYAIGDLIDGPMLAHKATAEGVLAAEAIAGEKVSRDDIHVIPDVVYTKPEIASVGINEDSAKQKKLAYKSGKFPLRALGRSLTTNESDGFIKYIADAETGNLIGVTIVSNRASDLISEAALALEMKANLEDDALTVHPHPSFSEGHMEAAAAALKKAIHIIN